jgi:hypothetical protein
MPDSSEDDSRKSVLQREENNILLRSLVGLAKIVGGAVVLLLVSGVVAAIFDHIKLSELGTKVDALALSISVESATQRDRIEKNSGRVTILETDLVSQKATVLALDGRVLTLERYHRDHTK